MSWPSMSSTLAPASRARTRSSSVNVDPVGDGRVISGSLRDPDAALPSARLRALQVVGPDLVHQRAQRHAEPQRGGALVAVARSQRLGEQLRLEAFDARPEVAG